MRGSARGALALAIAVATVVTAVAFVYGELSRDPRTQPVKVAGGGPLPLTADPDPDEPMDQVTPPVALAPPGGAIVQQGMIRLLRPSVDLKGQRRVGIQVGHWQTTEVPREYGTRLPTQTGASYAGYDEVDVNMDIADRTSKLLIAQGVAVDIIPTTVPVGYVADVFVALHCDSDGVGEISGFKMAKSVRRGPYEETLLNTIKEAYAKATGLRYDAEHVSRNMTGYFAHNWTRFQHSTSPFTPSVIMELGFISHDDDRHLLTERPDVVAKALADGILRFLDEHPRAKLFGEDLLVPQTTLPRAR